MNFQHCAAKDMMSQVQFQLSKVAISMMLFSCTGMGELEGMARIRLAGMGEQGVARIRLVGMGRMKRSGRSDMGEQNF